jgi:excisionase family DNA binding protein
LVGEQGQPETFLTGAEVAALLRVHVKTVLRWARAGHLPAHRTPGGHYRYRLSELEPVLSRVVPESEKEPSE